MSAQASARVALRNAGPGARHSVPTFRTGYSAPIPAARRAAGRGRPRPVPKPLTRSAKAAPVPRRSVPPATPGSFAASVLGTRVSQEERRSRRPSGAGYEAFGNDGAFSGTGGGADGGAWGKRKRRGAGFGADEDEERQSGNNRRGKGAGRGAAKAKDWFSSASRVAALEQAAGISAEFRSQSDAGALRRQRGEVGESQHPFAGGNFTPLSGPVPTAHWVAPYLTEVTHALEGNPDITADDKKRFLTDSVNALLSFGLDSPSGAYTIPQDPSTADYLLTSIPPSSGKNSGDVSEATEGLQSMEL